MEILATYLKLLGHAVVRLDGDGDVIVARDKFIDGVQEVRSVEIYGAVGGSSLRAMTIEVDVECDGILSNRCRIIDEIDCRLDVDAINR